MGRSNKELTHSGFTVETGHGGMKRNRDENFFGRGMDVFTRASMDIMRSNSPENRRKRSLDRTARDTQRDVQQDAEEKINRRSTRRTRRGGAGMPTSAGSGGSGVGLGTLSRGSGRPRTRVTVEDI